MKYYEKTISRELVYQGTILDVERLVVELPNGRKTKRDIVRNFGGSVVVPITDKGTIILVEQLRKPLDKIMLELPAGKIDDGESPEECARRELKEETGYMAENFKKILTLNPSPAFSDETLYVYLATGLSKGQSKPDEDEFISAKEFTLEETLKMIEQGIITDGKTIAGILMAVRPTKEEECKR